jgi:hypothetical protein
MKLAQYEEEWLNDVSRMEDIRVTIKENTDGHSCEDGTGHLFA